MIAAHVPHGGHRPRALFYLTGQTGKFSSSLRAFPVDAGHFGNAALLSFTGNVDKHKYGGDTAFTTTFGNLNDEAKADWNARTAEANSFFQISPAGDYQIEMYLLGSQTGDSNATLMLVKVKSGTDDVVLWHRPGVQNRMTGANFSSIYEFFLDDVEVNNYR